MTLQRCACLLFLFPVFLSAYNHPEIEWKSVTTEHFIITYYDRTEPAVYATWKIAEESYKVLAAGFKYTPREKIAISLADYEDYSNGFAEWTAANIQIWLPDLRTDLRSNTTWLRNVITHELTHILSLEQKRRMQTIAVSIGLDISTPDEHYGIKEPFARISAYPSWLVEGITQYETEQLGNDCYDSRREMALRGAVVSDNLLTLDEMGEFNHDMFGSEMVYNQGFAFTRYIAGKIGNSRLQTLFSDAAAKSTDIRQWFIEKTGSSLENLYDRWVDSLKVTFAIRFPQQDTKFTIVTDHGRFNLRPDVSPDGKYWSWLASGSDDGGRTDLVIAPYGSTKPIYRVAHAHTAHCFSAASDKVYFIKSRTPDVNGSFFNELHSLSLRDGIVRRLTSGGRMYDIAALPGGDLLCIRYFGAGFGLFRCSADGRSFSELVPGVQGIPFINIATAPHDSSFAVVSRIVDGRSRLLRYSFARRDLSPLGAAVAQEESPSIAKNGRVYFSADYDGVFNIYSSSTDGSDLKRHSNTVGGHFSPKIGPDGTIISSYFSANRFTIARFTDAGEPFTIPEQNRCTFLPLPVPKGVVTIKSRPYEAKLRRATWEVLLSGMVQKNSSLLTQQFSANRDSTLFGFLGGLRSQRTDALQKRIRLLQLNAGFQKSVAPEAPRSSSARATAESLPFRPELFTTKLAPPATQKMIDRKSSLLHPDYSTPFLSSRFRQLQSAQSDTDSTANTPSLLFFALPGLALENHKGVPTIGLELSAQLASMILPGYISVVPYFEVQLAREWSCGGRLDMASMPFSGFPLFAAIPFSLSWNRIGYYNEDLSYNGADITQMQITAGPRFIPSISQTFKNGKKESDTSVVNGWMAGLSLFHAVALLKYSSLQLLSSTQATYHSEKTTDDGLVAGSGGNILDGESNSYLYSANRAAFAFPVIRTINRGSRNYFDALYGRIGYTLFGYVNSSFFDRFPDDNHRLFTDPDYRTGSLFIDHAIGAGFDLGRYKSSLFFSTLSVDFSYIVLRSAFNLSLTSGF